MSSPGFLSLCLETLLLEPESWLTSWEEEARVEVRVPEETLRLVYRGLLLQEGRPSSTFCLVLRVRSERLSCSTCPPPGSLFGRSSSSQMIDSCTSGGDLYLEQGDVVHVQPPVLGSGWTVLRLADGARGTAPRPALEPLHPFHQ